MTDRPRKAWAPRCSGCGHSHHASVSCDQATAHERATERPVSAREAGRRVDMAVTRGVVASEPSPVKTAYSLGPAIDARNAERAARLNDIISARRDDAPEPRRGTPKNPRERLEIEAQGQALEAVKLFTAIADPAQVYDADHGTEFDGKAYVVTIRLTPRPRPVRVTIDH